LQIISEKYKYELITEENIEVPCYRKKNFYLNLKLYKDGV